MNPVEQDSVGHTASNPNQPLNHLEEWEDFLKTRYPDPSTARPGTPPAAASPFLTGTPGKATTQFRDYETTARPTVREFYRLNHRGQSYDFVRSKEAQFLSLDRKRMGIWEAMEFLNTLVDDSDPDTEMSQLEHLLQTAEQIRRDGHPDWFILTGLIHDLGKILCLFGEPQWAVVGDTFPVGCAFSDKIVFPAFFKDNPDAEDSRYQTEFGVYEAGGGLDRVHMSWGHDEYLYQVVKDYLPVEALYMIRYHSFYPWHREGAYEALTDGRDRAMLRWVQAFNPYDLYTKSHERPDVKALRPYYESLIAAYFPAQLRW